MKRVYQFSIVLLLLLTVTMANSRNQVVKFSSNGKTAITVVTDEYVFMKTNEMMWHYNGNDMILGATYPCSDGTKVGTNGLVTKPDNSTVQLKNGDRVLADGTITLASQAMDGTTNN